MKKLLALAFLSAAGLALTVGQASAWFCCHHGCNNCCTSKCCTTICCQPYNAFTPVCCGNITCTGCCPLSCGGCAPACCGQPPCCGGAPACCCAPAPGYPYGCGPACSEGYFGQLPILDGAHASAALPYQGPGYPMPGMNGSSLPAPTFQAPMPTPVTQNAPAGYAPGYNPAYPPMMPGTASVNAFVAPGSR